MMVGSSDLFCQILIFYEGTGLDEKKKIQDIRVPQVPVVVVRVLVHGIKFTTGTFRNTRKAMVVKRRI
jgi:hypothetical protein